jgi:hypothetical protein
MKATIRSYFGPIKVAISKKPKKKKKGAEKGKLIHRDCKLFSYYGNQNGGSSKH